MAELVDALDSKSGGSNAVRVQVPLRPPEWLFFMIIISRIDIRELGNHRGSNRDICRR